MPQPKRILRNLSLSAIAAVDRPCQEPARAAIIKRRDDPAPPTPTALGKAFAKYVGSEDGAHSYQEVLAENQFDQAVWPMVDALTQSIRSIVGDKSLTPEAREGKITQTVDQFLSDVRSEAGAAVAEKIESDISGLLSKREIDMNELEKAQARVEELTGQLASANALVASEKARADAAEEARKAAETERDDAKKALGEVTDETLKIGDQEIRKSVVGEASFSLAKGLAAERDIARIEKRVETEFRNVPGTTAEKAALLQAASALPEDARKTLETVLTATDKMVAQGFATLGAGGSDEAPNVAKARQDFEAKVDAIAKRDGIAAHEAMSKARRENPELFEAYQEANGAEG